MIEMIKNFIELRDEYDELLYLTRLGKITTKKLDAFVKQERVSLDDYNSVAVELSSFKERLKKALDEYYEAYEGSKGEWANGCRDIIFSLDKMFFSSLDKKKSSGGLSR